MTQCPYAHENSLITNSLRAPSSSLMITSKGALSVKRLLSLMKLADCTIFLLGAGLRSFHRGHAAKQPSLSHSNANEMQMWLKRNTG